MADSSLRRARPGHGTTSSARSSKAWTLSGLNTADPRYFNYIQNSVDALLAADGSIPTLKPEEHSSTTFCSAASFSSSTASRRTSAISPPPHFSTTSSANSRATPSGGFWHKQRYPNQMWLDGLYMAEPFRAEYASISHHPEDFADITQQFVLMEQHARDPKTGLLYHGWDESKQERWANKQTGDSSQFWARGMGWYMMALVDTLDYYPDGDPGRKQLLAILQREAAAVARYQDPTTRPLVPGGGQTRTPKETTSSPPPPACLSTPSPKACAAAICLNTTLANAERGYTASSRTSSTSDRLTTSRSPAL